MAAIRSDPPLAGGSFHVEPGDEARFWTIDRIHAAQPIFPIELSLAAEAFNPGFALAARSCGLPIAKVESRRIQGYLYSAIDWQTGEDAAGTGLDRLRRALVDLPENWKLRWLPEIQRHLAHWEGFDLAGAGDGALEEHLRDSLPRLRRLFELHFAITIPATGAVSLFEDLFSEVAGEAFPWTAFDLLRGFENRSLQRDAELRSLARQVRDSPGLLRLFEEFEGEELLARCAADETARAFLNGFRGFLEEFGAASDRPTLVEPAWSEVPRVPLGLVRALALDGAALERGGRTEAERARHEAEGALRQRAADLPQAVRDELELLLRSAREGNVLLEDHAYWIDQRVLFCARRLLLEAGRRCVERGLMEDREEVFHLSLDELLDVAAGGWKRPWQPEIAARREEMAAWSAQTPPPVLGRPGAGWPRADPILRALSKVTGGPPQRPTGPSELRGSPGSPGRVTGTARLISSAADAGRLRAGDILVAAATLPAWTPLFAIAAGLVTDEGGVLCHSACVAREYGLPAVVGTGLAMRVIRDGQTVTIDGDRGTVRLLG